MADGPVVGGDARPGEQFRAGGVGGIPEPEQRRRLDRQRVLPDRKRRDPDPAADEQRAPTVTRCAEPEPERPDEQQPIAGVKLAQPVRPGPHVLDQEPQLVTLGRSPQDAERARQERSPAFAPAPPRRRGEHVELPGLGTRAARVIAPQDDVVAKPLARGDRRGAPAERRLDAVGTQCRRSGVRAAACACPCTCAWISWSESTPGSLRRAAAIARAAAIPPDIVVMHGIPRAIAAERIS